MRANSGRSPHPHRIRLRLTARAPEGPVIAAHRRVGLPLIRSPPASDNNPTPFLKRASGNDGTTHRSVARQEPRRSRLSHAVADQVVVTEGGQNEGVTGRQPFLLLQMLLQSTTSIEPGIPKSLNINGTGRRSPSPAVRTRYYLSGWKSVDEPGSAYSGNGASTNAPGAL